ncbi:MAG: hypothetical protein R3D98_01405 [Candidatus Krumholzibacteriia bacterium]
MTRWPSCTSTSRTWPIMRVETSTEFSASMVPVAMAVRGTTVRAAVARSARTERGS